MPGPKNVIIFYTDQQRADSLGCMGNAAARTPNLDALAARGVLYRRHYATNTVCMPSRAAFITGRYAQANRVLDNGVHLPADQLTVAEVFRRSGYRTASFGKLHFQTFCPYEGDTSMESLARWAAGELDDWTGPYYGFEEVGLTVGHGEGVGGHYGKWRERRFPTDKLGAENAHGPMKFPKLACWKSNLPVEYHHSTWVADRAIEFLDGAGSRPFFLNVSFPDPHHPFTPPAPYSTMFDDADLPDPHAVEGENDAKPEPYRRAMTQSPFPTDGGARFHANMTPDVYRQIAAHTYGMVSLIDHSVGRVLARLDALGLADNTVIVFTSDHGEFLGDHFLLHKGQIPTRSLLNIPLIVADPSRPAGVSDAVCSNVDVAPTLLASCGIEVPECMQGVVLPEPGEQPRRDYAFQAGWSKFSPEYQHYTIYTRDWRISVFPNLRDGELYDLRADPWEHRSLFHDPPTAQARDELTAELLCAVGAAEPKRPPTVANW